MAAVVAVAWLWKPQLATTAVACLVYSCLRCSLNLSLSELLFASPASAVCLLGICVFPLGLLTYQASSGSSPQGSCGGKASILGGCSATETKQAEGQDTQLGECSTSQATDAVVLPNLECSSRPVRLAEPPFSTDLPRPLGNNRQLLSSSSRIRRRRLPHLSIELTPLPRLSVDFSGYRQSYSSYSRQASIRRSLDRGSMLPSEASGMLSSSCWSSCPYEGTMPSTAGAAASGLLTGSASLQLQQQLPTHAVGEATDSLGLSELPAGLSCIEEAINETHLLQVGAMLGESSSKGALAAREAGGPVGHPSSFYGSADTCEHMEPWELLVSEGNDNVLYWGWRKPLRKGLFMYMTRSVFLGASPAELRAFMMDDAYRVVWDQSMTVLKPLLNAETCGAAGGSASSCGGSCSNAAVEAMAVATAARMSAASETGEAVASPRQAAGCSSDSSSQGGRSAAVLPHESAVMQALVQFPKPMASRSYVYARRVWPRPSDGGCYCLSKACTAPSSASAQPGRGVSIEDYSSGCVIRAPSSQLLPPGADAAAPAAEVFMVYFEDSRVRASLANLGIKKGLWPLVQRTEKALRVYQAGAAANLHLQPAVAPAVPAACDISCSSIFQSSEGVSQDGARPAAARFSRSVSLSSAELGSEGRAAHSAALTRSVSMQSEHTHRLSSGSLPCFPLEAGLEEDEPAQEASCCCSHQAAASNTTCSSSSSQDHAKVQQQQRQVHGAAAAGKPSGSRWGWLGRVGSQLCGVIKQSTQLLAAASVVLWRSGPTVAMLLPSFEWRVVRWALQHITAPKQLLLGAPVTVTDSSCKAAARLPHSHPLGEWARPGLTSGLTTQVVRRLPSHPLAADELAGDSPTAVLRSDPALELRLAFASSSHGTASIAGSCGGSDVTSYSVGCSTCGCCCGGSTGGSSADGSRRCHRMGGSSSGGGSVVRDESGGKRHRRVVVKLVQIAGLTVARRVARLAGITE